MSCLVAITSSVGVSKGRSVDNADILKEAGFEILDTRETSLTKDVAEIFCDGKDHKIADYTSGPVAALLIRQVNGFKKFEKLAADFDHVYATPDEVCFLKVSRKLFPKPSSFERIVVIMKPGYNPDDYKLATELLISEDFVKILDQSVKISKEQEARIGCSNLTGGASQVMVFERMDAVDLAKIHCDMLENVFVSPSNESAAVIIDVLLSDGLPSERTLALIKPNAFADREKILSVIQAYKFEVIIQDVLRLSKSRAAEFYAEHKGKPFFGGLTEFMSSGPIMALVLQKPSAIKSWRTLIGPTNSIKARELKPQSLRARWGIDGTKNAFHGSDSFASSCRETDFFFPSLNAPRLNDPEEYAKASLNSLDVSLNDVLQKGLTKLCRAKPVGLDAIEWLGRWLIENNPARPSVEQPAPAEITATEIVVEEDGEEDDVRTLAARVKCSKVRIIAVLGPEGSRVEETTKQLARKHGVERISIPEMLQGAAKTAAKQVSEPLAEALAAGRSAPTDLMQYLLNNAIGAYLDTNPRKESPILLSSFPQNLDQALTFSACIGEPAVFLSFEGEAEEFESAAREEAKKAGTPEGTVERRLRRFKEEGMPVIAHYKKFSKVCTIRDRGDIEGVLEAVVAHAEL
uniref:Nucleoside diphosphate kinase-like domain-containing protein n=2 Tax=Lotharella globosa TaxID=91324 RepID=A0A7S4DEB2_9EUKA|mmetsp:Transcript_2867/g.5684  ORF Transcript_2867/g.5684 Transcript_2867/m.5684 type:complete len:633 (+) Transcript_2867:99-1997(+)